MSHETLQVLWFVLIAVLWIGFFFLEGFDFGVGIIHEYHHLKSSTSPSLERQEGRGGAVPLGRCSEAADWQRRMISVAEQGHATDLLGKLKASLKRYEESESCRPLDETSLMDSLLP